MVQINTTWQRSADTGRGSAGFSPIPNNLRLAISDYLTPVTPLKRIYPKTDIETTANSHHRVAYPGLRWECPIRCLGGSNPRWGVIITAPAGMVIGNGWSVDGNGVLTYLDDSLNLTWANPILGSHSIAIRVFSQDNTSVIFRFTLVVATGNHFFVGTVASGTGDGSTPNNVMAWSNAYLGDTIVGPAIGKVVVLRGGSYPMRTVDLNLSYNFNTVINYPDETPVFEGVSSLSWNVKSDNCVLIGIQFANFDITVEGVIRAKSIQHRLLVWRCKFINIVSLGGSKNQCGVYTDNQGVAKRKDYVISQCVFQDFRTSAYDFYGTENSLIDRNTFTILDPTFTSMGVSPVFFHKSGNILYEISFNVFDNPTVNASSSTNGIIYPYNAATTSPGPQTGIIEYNFVRCNGGSAIVSNQASNEGFYTTANNYIRRNTVIGGAVTCQNYDTTSTRFTYLDSNVIQNSNGGAIGTTKVPSSAAFTSINAECHGTSGIVDSNGALTGSYRSNWFGMRGSEVRKLS